MYGTENSKGMIDVRCKSDFWVKIVIFNFVHESTFPNFPFGVPISKVSDRDFQENDYFRFLAM